VNLRLALLMGLLLGARAQADTHGMLVPELRLAAGYDDNLFLDANPTGPVPSQIRADAIFDVAPRLTAQLTVARHVLRFSADYLERITPSNGDLRDLAARAEYGSPMLGPVRLLAAGFFEHYEASVYPEDTFDLGGAELTARVFAGDRVRLDARYRFGARGYASTARAGQQDLEHRAVASVRAQLLSRLALEVSYAFVHLDSNVATARFERHRGDLELSLRPVKWLVLTAAYGIGGQHLPTAAMTLGAPAPRDDLLQSVAVSASARPLGWLEIFCRYELLLSSSAAPNGQWQRNQFLAGLGFSFELAHDWVRRAPLAPDLAPGGRVAIRYRGHASRVSVVGDWNGWDPASAPLTRTGADEFAGTYTLPPGRHEYALVVDGVTLDPPDAPSYVPDGFGGRNGVLDVP
jgi:hypothetical protein